MALLRNFVTVGGGTAFSRVLGFVRDVMMAAALGTGPVADAFFVAFRFPNLFRRLFAEGAFNAAFVPLFGRALEEGGMEDARRFGSEALSALLTVLLILIAVAEIAMPALMYVLAPGFHRRAGQIRPHRPADADRLSLSCTRVADGAFFRRPQCAREVCRRRLRASAP